MTVGAPFRVTASHEEGRQGDQGKGPRVNVRGETIRLSIFILDQGDPKQDKQQVHVQVKVVHGK
jgi:hypothetical protein